MAALPEPRKFSAAVPSIRGEEPLLVGLIGPPGGGKTVSALRLATGMKGVRPGPIVLVDTEGGRSKKYSPEAGQKADPGRLIFDFHRVDMTPPFRSHDFLAVIHEQLRLNPAAIIVDTMSSEHEDTGGFLEWHDAIANAKKGEPGYIGGNEWAAWGPPKAARKRLLSGLMQIKVPLLFTFRAREKTQEALQDGKKKIINIGWMPVAPLEIVHSLDLTCILPPRADGVPVWSSEKVGEDFIVKLPHFLAPLIQKGALSEATGAALARWAKGEPAGPVNVGNDLKPPATLPSGQAAASVADVQRELEAHGLSPANQVQPLWEALLAAFGTKKWSRVIALQPDQLTAGLANLRAAFDQADALARMAEEREPGQDEEVS